MLAGTAPDPDMVIATVPMGMAAGATQWDLDMEATLAMA